MRIAVDAMGGDRAPVEIVHGAIAATRAGADVVLVGDTGRIQPILDEESADIDVVHATEVIEMADDPAQAIREKKDASVSVAARLVAAGDAAGMVSAGSTGAAMAAAAFIIGRLGSVSRPAIASQFPTGKFVLDSGANLECRPEHLVQFAVMGKVLAQTFLHIDDPKVGLISIGEERGKGRALEKDAYALLEAQPEIRFVGNVEGRDVIGDRADVLVSDGFTGNVLLKTAEGTGAMVMAFLGDAMADLDPAHMDELAPVVAGVRHMMNPERLGGAHLLGTRGVVVIAHGSSSRLAVGNAIGMAAEGASSGLVDEIARGLAGVAAAPVR